MPNDGEHVVRAERVVMTTQDVQEVRPVRGRLRIDLASRCGRPWTRRGGPQRNSCGDIQQVTAIAGVHVVFIVPPPGGPGIRCQKPLGDGSGHQIQQGTLSAQSCVDRCGHGGRGAGAAVFQRAQMLGRATRSLAQRGQGQAAFEAAATQFSAQRGSRAWRVGSYRLWRPPARHSPTLMQGRFSSDGCVQRRCAPNPSPVLAGR